MFWFWIRFQIENDVAINQIKGEVIVDVAITLYNPIHCSVQISWATL